MIATILLSLGIQLLASHGLPVTRPLLKYLIRHHAQTAGVDPAVALALAWTESRFTPDVVSKTKDYGLFQVHCGKSWSWCRVYGVTPAQLLDPVINVMVAVRIMRHMKRRCKKTHWLSCWNTGPGYAAMVLRRAKKWR